MNPTSHTNTHEKRHTKPCRFFQKGTCPLSAERCDFAHVKIQILPVRYSSGHLKPFQTGQCDHREGHKLAAPTIPIEIGIPKAAAPYGVPGTESHALDDAVAIAKPAVTKVPYGPRLYAHPAVSGRPPVANVPCAASVSSDDLSQLIFRGGDSSPTSDVPSLSDGDSDPPSAPCEAPELTERWPGSPPVASPMVYYHPTPGFFSPGAPFTHPTYGVRTSPRQVTRSDSRRHGMSARKLKALKTKQCKFFKKDGRCPQGNLCTFIHDPSAVQNAPTSEQESDSDSPPDPSRSPSEPCSNAEEDRARNVFPIMWRVIGGGVMMGGQREVCPRSKDGVCPDGDDCPYVHPWEDDVQTPAEPTYSPTPTPRASHFAHAQMHVAASMGANEPGSPVPELIPDISPIAVRGCKPASFLGVGEDLPPRPYSTPPRISSRAEAAPPMTTHNP